MTTFDDLRRSNKLRLPEFRNRLGRRVHANADGSDWSIAEWTNAMAGECGEACNIAKKIRRGDYDDNLQEGIRALLDEIADVVIYADIACQQVQGELGLAVVSKFNRKSEQVGSKVRL